MIDKQFALYLDTQADLVALLPEQPWLSGTATEKRKASIFRRRASQDADTPYIIVAGLSAYDDGNHTSGVDGCKIARFRVIVASQTSINELDPIRDKLKQVINNARNVFMPTAEAENKIRVQCLLIENIVSKDGKSEDGKEEGLPGYEFWLLASFYE